MPPSPLAQKALAIPEKIRQSYLLDIPEVELHGHICQLLENMDAGARCEITHGRDEYGRDIVLRRTSPFGHEYVAIVVKRGDASGKISARTSGPIDHIISQVTQSMKHPCYLKDIEVGKVRIGGVMVMFFGRLTGNAAKRIMLEAPAVARKTFTIDWLNRSFANYFPEVFFAGAASTYLQEKVIELETQHDLSRRPENLSEWYVEPSVAITQIDALTFNQRLKRALKLRRLSYRQFLLQLNSQKHFVLSAAPGLGKSTLLRKLTLDMFREALRDSASLGVNIDPGAIRIPILVSAIDVMGCSDAESFLGNFLPPDDVRTSFSVACLLVDALDEVPQPQQEATLNAANQIAEFIGCSLVVSARPVHVVRALADESSLRLPVVQLLPFEVKQALQLVGRLVDDGEIVEILKDGITSLRSHMSLSPLSVSLLLDIAEAEREVPGTIGEIFEQYIDIALGRYDLERGIDVVFQFFVKTQMLAELAFVQFFQRDRLRITKEEFDNFVMSYCRERALDHGMMARLQEDIDRSGLIHFGDDIGFAHRSFLDFFIAFYVNSHANDFDDFDRFLGRTYFDDKWSEVAFYVFALRRELSAGFLANISDFEGDDVDYHMRRFSLGRLLQAAWLSPRELKRSGITIGVGSASRLFEMISEELDSDAPGIVPYGVMIGLAERAYNSRTLCAEVALVIDELVDHASPADVRNAINLLWAISERLGIDDVSLRVDAILDAMGELEARGELSLGDKTVAFLLLEGIAEGDQKLRRAISRRLTRLVDNQPEFVRRLFLG